MPPRPSPAFADTESNTQSKRRSCNARPPWRQITIPKGADGKTGVILSGNQTEVTGAAHARFMRVCISGAVAGTPAASAKVPVGWELFAVNGVPVLTPEEMVFASAGGTETTYTLLPPDSGAHILFGVGALLLTISIVLMIVLLGVLKLEPLLCMSGFILFFVGTLLVALSGRQSKTVFDDAAGELRQKRAWPPIGGCVRVRINRQPVVSIVVSVEGGDDISVAHVTSDQGGAQVAPRSFDGLFAARPPAAPQQKHQYDYGGSRILAAEWAGICALVEDGGGEVPRWACDPVTGAALTDPVIIGGGRYTPRAGAGAAARHNRATVQLAESALHSLDTSPYETPLAALPEAWRARGGAARELLMALKTAKAALPPHVGVDLRPDDTRRGCHRELLRRRIEQDAAARRELGD
eukprot:gene41-50568_t